MTDTNYLVAEVVGLAATFDEHFLELARTLRQLHEMDASEFRRAANKAKIGLRKAYCLIAIDRTFSALPVEKFCLQKIGWTKLNLLVGHVDEQNLNELLHQAHKHTAKELEAALRGSDPESKQRAVVMHFSPHQFAEFEEAMVMLGAIRKPSGMANREGAMIALTRWALDQKMQ